MEYNTTIGLEVHAELNTQSKMFCDCKNDPLELRANQNVCPICLAHPGTLPVINKQAVESVIKVGLALGGKIPEVSKFDRKNYFYPDLPKGYQISQYDEPLVLGGELAGVKITRVHLEEDTGRLGHPLRISRTTPGAVMVETRISLVDFNRAGVPLMELVTEPVIHDAETALTFAKELQLLLRYLKVSDADMEKGQMRVEANISLMVTNGSTNNTNKKNSAPANSDIGDISGQISGDSRPLGTKVEVKNLNSFRAVQGAIAYEIARQKELLEAGKKVTQETRGWNEEKKITFSQRLKESAHDYRYFPEPDLPPLHISEWDMPRLRAEIPELPKAKRIRFIKEYSLSAAQVETLVLDSDFADYFEKVASELKALCEEHKKDDFSYEPLLNYLTSDLRGLLHEQDGTIADLKFMPEHFAHLVFFAMTNKISSRAAKDILKKTFETGLDPEEILETENLGQVSDASELETTVLEIISENPGAVADFKKGKENALQFLIGKAMGRLKGRGNPSILAELFRTHLSK